MHRVLETGWLGTRFQHRESSIRKGYTLQTKKSHVNDDNGALGNILEGNAGADFLAKLGSANDDKLTF
ncbi:unnamed protein product [Trifolium pratense]|uniref:Uncharacterized protein n=1 Tax=Trifolium pratense TaxID=57577 RepID=A0ACB0M7B7_TRIPR|nr:unnamed protein product [Trifolium pratense]